MAMRAFYLETVSIIGGKRPDIQQYIGLLLINILTIKLLVKCLVDSNVSVNITLFCVVTLVRLS